MPVEIGNLTQLAYIAEATFGTTPSTPTGQLVRWVPPLDLAADAAYIDNPEFRTDGLKAVGRRGGLRGKGSISGALSYGTFDDFLAAGLGNTAWASNIVKVAPIVVSSAASITVSASGKTFTRGSGSFVTDGFVVGQTIVTSGDGTNSGNNGYFVVSNVAALVLTCSTASGLVDATVAGMDIMVNIRPSFTIEKGHKTNGLYFPFTGCVVEGFTLTGKINAPVDVKFDLVSKAVGSEAVSSLFSALTAVNTNPLITTWEGSIKKGGVSVPVVSWDLKVARNLDLADVCGSTDLYDIQPKTTLVTGSVEVYFDSYALYTDFRAENDLVLQINLGPGGTKSYTLDLAKVRVKKFTGDPKEGLMTCKIDFESYAPSSSDTSLKITRLP